MSQQYKAVAAILKNTIATINQLLTDPADELHRLSVTNDLQRTHDRLLLLTGTGDVEAGQSVVLGPAKTIGGVPIGKQRRFTEKDLVPSDDKVFKLKQDIDDALVYFGPDANAAGILANIPELIIRGVARKAGLKVSKDDPKEITVEFIEKIKESQKNSGLTFKMGNPFLKEGEGGISKVVVLSPEDIGKPMGEGVVTENEPSLIDQAKAATEENINNGLADAIMGGDPSVVGDGLASKVEPATEKIEEPKQDPKPDPKKKPAK